MEAKSCVLKDLRLTYWFLILQDIFRGRGFRALTGRNCYRDLHVIRLMVKMWWLICVWCNLPGFIVISVITPEQKCSVKHLMSLLSLVDFLDIDVCALVAMLIILVKSIVNLLNGASLHEGNQSILTGPFFLINAECCLAQTGKSKRMKTHV